LSNISSCIAEQTGCINPVSICVGDKMRADQSALPKYIQVSEMLIRDIVAGRISDGARLPPERDMAGTLGVAVGTLRKALSELEDKGLLERVHGSGNYVRNRPESAGLYAFFRLELPDGGGLPTADVIDVAKLIKPADLPVFGRSKDAHRIRRVRSLSATPVAVEEIWLDGHWAVELQADRVSESLYFFYRRALGLWITQAEDRVSLSSGFVERFGETADGEIAEYSRTWFNAAKARYVSRMR
jgi:GntR family transcriptional regulator